MGTTRPRMHLVLTFHNSVRLLAGRTSSINRETETPVSGREIHGKETTVYSRTCESDSRGNAG